MCNLCKMDPSEVKRELTRQGAVEPDDFYKETDYTPRKKRNNKICKKSKTGEPHDFSVERIRGKHYLAGQGLWWWSTEKTCSRCGKHDWNTVEFHKGKNDPEA